MPQPLLLRLQCVPPFLAQNLKAWQTRLNSELTLKEGREKKLHKLPNQHTYHTCIFCFIGYSLKVLPFPPPSPSYFGGVVIKQCFCLLSYLMTLSSFLFRNRIFCVPHTGLKFKILLTSPPSYQGLQMCSIMPHHSFILVLCVHDFCVCVCGCVVEGWRHIMCEYGVQKTIILCLCVCYMLMYVDGMYTDQRKLSHPYFITPTSSGQGFSLSLELRCWPASSVILQPVPPNCAIHTQIFA